MPTKTIVCNECSDELEVDYENQDELDSAIRDANWQRTELPTKERESIYICEECAAADEDAEV